MSRRQVVGRWGEGAAASYLIQRGYEIIQQNFRTPYGEIDIIARQGDELVFVEVKTRTSSSFGLPENAITPRKQRHMLDSASSYLSEHPEYEGSWRIDVAAVSRNNSGSAEIIYFENAVNEPPA